MVSSCPVDRLFVVINIDFMVALVPKLLATRHYQDERFYNVGFTVNGVPPREPLVNGTGRHIILRVSGLLHGEGRSFESEAIVLAD